MTLSSFCMMIFFSHVKHSFLQNPNTLVQQYETNQGLNNDFGGSISFRVNLNSLKRDLTKLIFFTSENLYYFKIGAL